MIVKLPGSTTRRISRFKNDNSSGPTENSTTRDSPGFNVTRRNPLNSLIARVTELTSCRTYICTTSSPRTAEVFVTSTEIFVRPDVFIESGNAFSLVYANVE